jgi:hypothetical protein
LLPGQIDISARIIELLELIGLVKGVVRVPPAMIERARRQA